MTRSRMRGRATALGIAILSLSLLAAGGQIARESAPAPVALEGIEHEPASCMDTETFPLIRATAQSAELARSVQDLAVRFRAEQDPGWYEVDFGPPAGATFDAVLPRPLPESARVVYYVVRRTVPEQRSPEYIVSVLTGGCPGALSAEASVARDLRVRRTTGTQRERPLGFSDEGIRPGGGLSKTTLGLIGAAAGGAGIAAIALAGEDTGTGGPVVPPPTPGTLRACFTPDPIPDIPSGSTILLDASCTVPETVTSFEWDFGDGTPPGTGSSIEHLYSPGGVYRVSLTVRDGARSDTTSRVIRVLATPLACFVTNPDPPRIPANESINFNGECSVGDRDGGSSQVVSFEWDFGDGRPGAEGVFVSRQFEPDVYGVTLTVTNEDGRQSSKTQFVVVEPPETSSQRSQQRRQVSVLSVLELRSVDGTEAYVRWNESADASAIPGAPQQFTVSGRGGDNLVEATVRSGPEAAGRWRFDFRGTAGFEPGSLRVESGRAIGVDAHSVVFQIQGGQSPPIRFRYRLTGR